MNDQIGMIGAVLHQPVTGRVITLGSGNGEGSSSSPIKATLSSGVQCITDQPISGFVDGIAA
jgi:hypothetical protein